MFRRKIKKLLSLIAATTMAVTALTGAMSVSAETDSGDCGEVKWSFDSSTGKLTISGNGAMATPKVIDATLNNIREGHTLESQLGDYPDIFTYKKEHMEDIKEVEIKEGVTSIGFCAFYKMPNLETVVLPKTISEFKGVGIIARGGEPSSMANEVHDYASYAFAECPLLKNLTLTEGMTAIGAYAFYKCTALESVDIPSTIKRVGFSADTFQKWGVESFSGCSKLKNITLPEGLEIIGARAFANTAVESIVIPSTITCWVDALYNKTPELDLRENVCCAFADCKKLSSVTFADGLRKIGKAPFCGCTSLRKVSIPKSLFEMYGGLAYCTGLQEVYIEDGAQFKKDTDKGVEGDASTRYGIEKAFYNCENLKKIEFYEGIDTAYHNAQWCKGCDALTDIYLHGKNQGLPIYNNTTIKVHAYTDSAVFKSSNFSDEQKINIEEDISTYLDIVKTRLETAKKYDEEKYTPESYAVLKALIEKAEKFDENSCVLDMQWTDADLRTAIKGLEKKPDEPSSDPSSDPSSEPSSDLSSDPSSDPSSEPSSENSSSSNQTNPPASAPTTAKPATKAPTTPIATTNAKAVKAAKDKANAEKIMKQAKITKLTAKAKGKKKIVVSWKKVKNAKGYEVQVATNKKFKKNKIIVTKNVKGKKVTIKSSKIKRKKTYYIRVRAYTTYQDANGITQKVYSSWIKKIRKVKAK